MSNIVRIIVLLLALPLVGVAGFMLVEGWSFLDALYMAVITITTVGYEEVHPLSDGGRIFVVGYLVAGLGVFFYGVAQVGEVILQTQLRSWLGRRKMEKAVKFMKDHFIVCGLGRMGRHLCAQLARSRQSPQG